MWNGNLEMKYHKENNNNTHTMHKYQLNECSFCFRKVEKVRTRRLRYALILYRCSFLMAIQWYWFYSKTKHDIAVFISSFFFVLFAPIEAQWFRLVHIFCCSASCTYNRIIIIDDDLKAKCSLLLTWNDQRWNRFWNMSTRCSRWFGLIKIGVQTTDN